MRRFPIISIGLLVAATAALVAIGYIAETYCAFGFGGFGCSAPFVGWGETLFAAVLGFMALSAILVAVVLWQLFAWWLGRRRAVRRSTPT